MLPYIRELAANNNIKGIYEVSDGELYQVPNLKRHFLVIGTSSEIKDIKRKKKGANLQYKIDYFTVEDWKFKFFDTDIESLKILYLPKESVIKEEEELFIYQLINQDKAIDTFQPINVSSPNFNKKTLWESFKDLMICNTSLKRDLTISHKLSNEVFSQLFLIEADPIEVYQTYYETELKQFQNLKREKLMKNYQFQVETEEIVLKKNELSNVYIENTSYHKLKKVATISMREIIPYSGENEIILKPKPEYCFLYKENEMLGIVKREKLISLYRIISRPFNESTFYHEESFSLSRFAKNRVELSIADIDIPSAISVKTDKLNIESMHKEHEQKVARLEQQIQDLKAELKEENKQYIKRITMSKNIEKRLEYIMKNLSKDLSIE